MTNETTVPDLIKRLRFCGKLHPKVGYHENGKLFNEAADALEAAQARIAELEKVAKLNASAWEMLSAVTDVPVAVTATALELGKGTRAALEGKG